MDWLIAHGIIDGILAVIIAIVGWLLWGFSRAMDRNAEQMREEREERQARDEKMMEAQEKIADSLQKLAIEVSKDYVTRAEMGRQITSVKNDIMERVRTLEGMVHVRRS